MVRDGDLAPKMIGAKESTEDGDVCASHKRVSSLSSFQVCQELLFLKLATL